MVYFANGKIYNNSIRYFLYFIPYLTNMWRKVEFIINAVPSKKNSDRRITDLTKNYKNYAVKVYLLVTMALKPIFKGN